MNVPYPVYVHAPIECQSLAGSTEKRLVHVALIGTFLLTYEIPVYNHMHIQAMPIFHLIFFLVLYLCYKKITFA